MARPVSILLALALGLAACSDDGEPAEPTPEELAALARLEEAKQEALAEVDRVRKEALAELEEARARAAQAAPAAPAEPGAAVVPQPGSLTGQVLARGSDRLSLRTPDGLQYDLDVSERVEVFRAGRPAEWRTVQEGTQVRASYRPVGEGFVVERIDVVEGGAAAGTPAAPPAPAAPDDRLPEAPAGPGGRSLPPEAPAAPAAPEDAPPPAESGPAEAVPENGVPERDLPEDRYRDD